MHIWDKSHLIRRFLYSKYMPCNFTLGLALDKELLKVHICSYKEIWEHTLRIFPPPGSLGNHLTRIFQQIFKTWRGISVNFIDVLNITHELHDSKILPNSPKWSLCQGESPTPPHRTEPLKVAAAVSFPLWAPVSPQCRVIRAVVKGVVWSLWTHSPHPHFHITVVILRALLGLHILTDV